MAHSVHFKGIDRKHFKVIGYLPGWSGDVLDRIDWDKLTHINYAFAIPTKNADILPLMDPCYVQRLIETAHRNHVCIGLSVGGWSYENVILEGTFVQATNTVVKCRNLAFNILDTVCCYGFDGVDVDWEYPRAGISSAQYECLMAELHRGLSKRGKFLSAAVIGYGDVALGQTDYVIKLLDWINVMAYDLTKDAGHSPYEEAVNSTNYWINTRRVAREKIVLGVPFYARPDYIPYSKIVAGNPCAALSDTAYSNGTLNYYNGLATIANKTRWACEHVGGIMIWEITQDSTTENLSLLNQIHRTTQEYCNRRE